MSHVRCQIRENRKSAFAQFFSFSNREETCLWLWHFLPSFLIPLSNQGSMASAPSMGQFAMGFLSARDWSFSTFNNIYFWVNWQIYILLKSKYICLRKNQFEEFEVICKEEAERVWIKNMTKAMLLLSEPPEVT